MARQIAPTSFDEAAAALQDAATAATPVRVIGGGTKPWGRPGVPPGLQIRTAKLDRIVEHNAGDLTAVLEAGVPLAKAQQQFATSSQMLALDPYLGPEHEATIGGIIATADAGPLRHRYGAPRDLILGVTVALSDGTIARSGGKVIKNVAGYDLGKLFCGSLGTLGMILSVNVRLHPLPAVTLTTLGVATDPDTAARAAHDLTAAPLELEALDVAWRGGRGGILARCAGVQSRRRAEMTAALMSDAGLRDVEVTDDDAELWARQRSGQRSPGRALVRVAAQPSALATVLRVADAHDATVVGRAAYGHFFIALDPAAAPDLLRALPPGATAVLHDAPAALVETVDPWGGSHDPAALELMRRVKARFDPRGVCSPGVFVGGI
ncbi:MAG TPA: FAD-binding oxidoreductase [Solirubrobacteraceae bacterium]|nr:FAD-binding oxidoreductase [Solirubrobacteraceae bacterium]